MFVILKNAVVVGDPQLFLIRHGNMISCKQASKQIFSFFFTSLMFNMEKKVNNPIKFQMYEMRGKFFSFFEMKNEKRKKEEEEDKIGSIITKER